MTLSEEKHGIFAGTISKYAIHERVVFMRQAMLRLVREGNRIEGVGGYLGVIDSGSCSSRWIIC
jgi:hypothetical protein